MFAVRGRPFAAGQQPPECARPRAQQCGHANAVGMAKARRQSLVAVAGTATLRPGQRGAAFTPLYRDKRVRLEFSTASTLRTLKRAEARASAALVHGARIVPIRSMSPNQSASKSSQPSLVIPPAASWDNSRSAGVRPAGGCSLGFPMPVQRLPAAGWLGELAARCRRHWQPRWLPPPFQTDSLRRN